MGKNRGSWVQIDVGLSGFYLASAGSSSSCLGRLQPSSELSRPKFIPSIVSYLLPAYMAGSQGFLFCCLKSCSESLCCGSSVCVRGSAWWQLHSSSPVTTLPGHKPFLEFPLTWLTWGTSDLALRLQFSTGCAHNLKSAELVMSFSSPPKGSTSPAGE